nr:MFS transporter [Rhodococcus sp. BP-260]
MDQPADPHRSRGSGSALPAVLLATAGRVLSADEPRTAQPTSRRCRRVRALPAVLLATAGRVLSADEPRTAQPTSRRCRRVVILIATALMVAVFFLGTFYFQQSAGHGPLVTGLLFLPIAVATMTGANLGGRLIGRWGARILGTAGMLIAALGLLVPALWATTAATTIGVSFGAFGIGALFVVASATALGQIGPEEAGIASGLLSTFHEFGASIGVATVSSIAALSLVAGGGDTGFQHAFLFAAAAAALAAMISAVVIPPRPAL